MMELSTPTTLHAATLREAISTSAQRIDLYHRVLEQIQAVPGVESAGIIGDLFIGNTTEQVLTVERRRRNGFRAPAARKRRGQRGFLQQPSGRRCSEAASFRSGMGPMLRGLRSSTMRWLAARGPGAIQSEEDSNLALGIPTSPWYTVVGVVADMRRQGQEREPVPQMFESLAQNPPQSADLFIRTSSDHPAAMAGALRAAVRRVEKHAPIYGVAPLDEQLGSYLAQRRFQTSLLAGFSVVALLMAAVGIYGLIQYSVATRTQEIGLRMALGAEAGHIFRMMIGEGLTLSLTGLALGLVGAWWLGRAGSSLLFGVTATDPLTFTAVSLVAHRCRHCSLLFPSTTRNESGPDSRTTCDVNK